MDGPKLPGKTKGWTLMSNLSVGAEEAIARRRPSKVSLRHRSSGRRQLEGGGTGSSATGRVTGGGPNSSSRGAHANAGGTATGELQLEHSPDSDSKLPVNKPLSALQQAAERVANLSAAMRVAYAPFNRQLYALLGRYGSTIFGTLSFCQFCCRCNVRYHCARDRGVMVQTLQTF